MVGWLSEINQTHRQPPFSRSERNPNHPSIISVQSRAPRPNVYVLGTWAKLRGRILRARILVASPHALTNIASMSPH